MKAENKILIAFILNLFFSIFEFIGGIITSSTAIISDSLHDFGDACAILVSYILEKISLSRNDKKYYSHIGGFIITAILIIGSIIAIINSVYRLFNPVVIDYNKMIIFAIVGFTTNLIATIFTHNGNSFNQKAINLHMLEDVLGWAIVLIGAVIMNYTNIYILDPIMSIAVAIFILICAIKNAHHHH